MERTGPPADAIFYAFWRIAQQGWPIIEVPYQRCDMAHNRAACLMMQANEEAMAAGRPDLTFTHLVTLDLDHTHPVEIVRHFGKVVQMFPDRLVVGGLNYRRCAPYDPCAYIDSEDGGVSALTDPQRQGIGKVDFLGTGSMIIAASVFEQMRAAGTYPFFGYEYKPQPWRELEWRTLANMQFGGVDVYFSRRCKELGIDRWLDAMITSPHLANRWIDGDDWQREQQTPEFRWKYLAHDERLAHLRRLIPELWANPGRVLYVGANKQRAHYLPELTEAGATVDLLEIDEGKAAYWQERGGFDQVHVGDVQRWCAGDALYDVAFCWHGPEHIEREQLDDALANLESAVKPGGLIVLGCPWGQAPYADEEHYDAHEQHVGAYYPEDFEQRGYTVFVDGTRDRIESSQIAWKRKQ